MSRDVIAARRIPTTSTYVTLLVQYDVIAHARKSAFRASTRSWLHNLVRLLRDLATDNNKSRLRGNLFINSLPSNVLTFHSFLETGHVHARMEGRMAIL
jgi:hypothetical protein